MKTSLRCAPRAVILLFLGLLVPCPAAIVINEIHFDPDIKTERAEFIELFNTANETVNLAGWRLAGAVSYTFPSGASIPANGYVVIAEDPATILSKYSASALGPWQGTLSNEGEEIELLNAAGSREDSVDYDLGFPWPTVGEAPGYSIELIHPSLDNDLGGNWRASYSGQQSGGSFTLIEKGSVWKYFPGESEPPSNWRSRTFDDSQWLSGPAPIGYDPSIPLGTVLSGMREHYTTVYFRRNFVVTSVDEITSLGLEAMFDDGFKLWINGQAIRDGDFNMAEGELPYTATAGPAQENGTYRPYPLGSPTAYLLPGTNVIAIQAANSHISSSSDFYLDVKLTGSSTPPSSGPTPGALNSVYKRTAPPAIRQVEHSPKQPNPGTPVRITAKITDPQGVQSVSLEYQVVEPGAYVALSNAAYAQNWIAVPMSDTGTGGDALAGDSVYTVIIPSNVQQNRRLIRYRITCADQQNASIRAPYLDDPVPNFAYFCYAGVPGHQAAVNPQSTPLISFASNEMQRLPALHLVAARQDVENATWFSKYGGDEYLWPGTLVYDGEVYDHVRFRARGGVWRYAMTKNMWKFDMHRGHSLQMRDDYGRKYSTKWAKLNLGASIQQGDYGHRGEQGMFESVGFRLFNLAGVESPRTTFLQFRVVDDVAEANPSNQYEGDFWGVYLAVEQEDGRFLDEHGMPDGNLYKMEAGTGELNNVAPTGPLDKSDLNSFLTYRSTTSPVPESWWRTNFNLAKYYNYQAIVQAIHHYDICAQKNYFYYRNPVSGLWSVHSWDLDLTWADNMYNSGCGGVDDLYRPVFGGNGHPEKPAITIEYRNRVREIADLLYNTDQAWKIIDEHAQLLRGPANNKQSILEADRCQWDYNPKMADSAYGNASKAGQGRFYQWPYEPGVSKDFEGCVQLMKNYVVARGNHLSGIFFDATVPLTPSIQYVGAANYPVNKIRLRCSNYAGTYSFASMKWRVGEVSYPGLPSYSAGDPWIYEIEPVWESPEITQFSSEIDVPPGVLKPGRTYRARVQFKDASGRTSRWSPPLEFNGTLPDNAALLAEHLKITELMFDPPEGSFREYVELFNASSNLTLNLEGAKFTSGIDYVFPAGQTLAPGSYLLVMRDTDVAGFRAHYGVPAEIAVLGPYSGSLNNDGEQVTLKTGPAGIDIASFEYGKGRLWPAETQGSGHSLVPLASTFSGQATGALDYPLNWRASSYLKGSPGKADPPVPQSTLRINEVLAHTDYNDPSRPDYDSNDWIELVNTTSADFTLQNWFLSDSPGAPRKWALPSITLPAHGRLVLDEISGFHNPITAGFGLDKAGEQILLSYLPGSANDRVVDSVRFKGQENGFSLSRYPDGAAWWFRTAVSSNAPNTAPLPGLVISEIMYRPPMAGTNDDTTHEFVEIWNPTGTAVTLQDTNGSWRIDGGIAFTFPGSTVLPARACLLLVNFDPADSAVLADFRAYYGLTNTTLQILGPYAGKLGNRSDRIALEKGQFPDVPGDPYSWIVLDEVTYGNQHPWPPTANGGGQALARLSAISAGDDPANWASGAPTPGWIVSINADTDGDGLPDAWEEKHGLDPNSPADAIADADGDGFANWKEFLSGTDPKDATSFLGLSNVTFENGIAVLEFRAMPGKTYTLQFCPALAQGEWTKVVDVPAQGEERTIKVQDPGSENFGLRYYRLVTPEIP